MVDASADVGQHSSLALDAAGNPVIAYYDATGDNLKLAHCNDPNCDGGNETIRVVDSVGNVGLYASMALGAGGAPVIAYFDGGGGGLKVAQCNDPDCDGGDETIRVVATGAIVPAPTTSLAIDVAGNPVIAYSSYFTSSLIVAST